MSKVGCKLMDLLVTFVWPIFFLNNASPLAAEMFFLGCEAHKVKHLMLNQ